MKERLCMKEQAAFPPGKKTLGLGGSHWLPVSRIAFCIEMLASGDLAAWVPASLKIHLSTNEIPLSFQTVPSVSLFPIHPFVPLQMYGPAPRTQGRGQSVGHRPESVDALWRQPWTWHFLNLYFSSLYVNGNRQPVPTQ